MSLWKKISFVALAATGVYAVSMASEAERVDKSFTLNTPQITKVKSFLNFNNSHTLDIFKPKRFINREINKLNQNEEYIYFTINRSGTNSNSNDTEETPQKGQINIYFPTDGHQPTNQEAGIYSGAREQSEEVTSWYMHAFGYKDQNISQGFEVNSRDIITVEDPSDSEFFWENFRTIASDPVGRVLLYRILIEINRADIKGRGTQEYIDKIWRDYFKNTTEYKRRHAEKSLDDVFFATREKFKTITVKVINSSGFESTERSMPSFGSTPSTRGPLAGIQEGETSGILTFPRKLKMVQSLLSIPSNTSQLITAEDDYDYGIFLFHEMLHWFHELRLKERCKRETGITDRNLEELKYSPFVFYCAKNQIEHGNVWLWINEKEYTKYYVAEEVRTILGVPNYKSLPQEFLENIEYDKDGYHKFLNGDDLSENVYRLSRSMYGPAIAMRFGHRDSKLEAQIASMNPFQLKEDAPLEKNAIRLAHRIAIDCYKDITGRNEVTGWDLKQGEALAEKEAAYRPSRTSFLMF